MSTEDKLDLILEQQATILERLDANIGKGVMTKKEFQKLTGKSDWWVRKNRYLQTDTGKIDHTKYIKELQKIKA